MLIGKLIRKTIKKPETNPEASSGCVLPILAFMVVAALLLKILSIATPEKTVPLLTVKDGMQRVINVDDISKYTTTKPLIPTETFETDLFVIGVYTEDSATFPKDSIALVYTLDNQRVFEIDKLSKGTLEEYKSLYPKTSREEIVLVEDTPALLVQLRDHFDCTYQNGATHPSMCQLTNLIIFKHNNSLIKIFVDGKKLTEGELISIAKSIVN